MQLHPKHLGCLAYGLLFWGASTIVGGIASGAEGAFLASLLVGSAFIGLGASVHRRYRQRRRAAAEPVASAASADACRSVNAQAEIAPTMASRDRPSQEPSAPRGARRARPPFRLVLVVSEDTDEGLFGQLLGRLVDHVTKAPHYALAPGAEITTLTGTTLPDQTRQAVEPFVWSLQERFGRRGGAWEVDFHETMGMTFAVVFLE